MPVNLPVPKSVSPQQQAAYKIFLIRMVELINYFLRPDVTSKWVKIDLIMVPVEIFPCVSFLFGTK